VDDSLLVDGEDFGSFVFNVLCNEDLLDDGSGSPLNSSVVSVDLSVDNWSWNSDVSVSDNSSDSVDNSSLLVSESVDDSLFSGELSLKMDVDSGVQNSEVVDMVRDVVVRVGNGENSSDLASDVVDSSSESSDDSLGALANSSV